MTLTQNSLSLVQLPLPQRPQSDCEFLDDNVEKDAAEEDVPAIAGQQGAHWRGREGGREKETRLKNGKNAIFQ